MKKYIVLMGHGEDSSVVKSYELLRNSVEKAINNGWSLVGGIHTFIVDNVAVSQQAITKDE